MVLNYYTNPHRKNSYVEILRVRPRRIEFDVPLLRLSGHFLECIGQPFLVLRVVLQCPLEIGNTLARLYSTTHLSQVLDSMLLGNDFGERVAVWCDQVVL